MSQPPPAGRAPGWREVLCLALALGLGGGLLEGISHFARARFLDTNLPLGAYMAWMPAVANGAFFLLLALPLLPAVGLAPRLLTGPRIVGGFTCLAGMAALRAFDNYLSIAVVDVLALGVAVQVARWIEPRWETARRRLPAIALGLAGLVASLAGGLEARYALAERRALAALPTPPASAPNVLLLVLDTVRRFNLSTYGYDRPTTPGLTQLAEGGVLFEQAVAPAPWTLPSHASIMTGRWAHELSASWSTPLDGRDSTLAEALAARGYRTAGFTGNISYAGRSVGIDRGFSHFDGVRLTVTQIARSATFTSWVSSRHWARPHFHPYYKSTYRKTAPEVNEAFLDWIDSGEPRPFFAFLNYFDAHDDYLPQPPFDRAFAEPAYPALPAPAHPGGHRDATPRGQREYDQAIAYLDHEIGALLRALNQRNLLANTLVIVTSDHGEEFGEHGMYGHGHTLYLPALAVPLIMALPERLPKGQRVPVPVSLRDLPATVMDITSGAAPVPFPGRSLARFWQGQTSQRDTLLVETRKARGRPDWDATSRGDLQGVLLEDLSFIRGVGIPIELHAWPSDPSQRENLAGSPAFASTVRLLNDLLDTRMGAPGRP